MKRSARLGHCTATFAASVALVSGLAVAAYGDVDERDILLAGTGETCSPSLERKKVKLHKNEGRKGHKQDVVVWQVMNDCDISQKVLLCVDNATILDSCSSLPPSAGAAPNVPFEVLRKMRVSLACRGGAPGTAEIELYAGADLKCLSTTEDHVIDIEVVP